jgi:hypothetical protein
MRADSAQPDICEGMHGSITNGSNRDMGKLIRAAAGFAIALTLLHGPAYWAGLKSSSTLQIEADIAAQRPGMHLQASLDDGLAGLEQMVAPRNGTRMPPNLHDGQARGLHF